MKKLPSRERAAVSYIEFGYKRKHSLEKIKRILQVRFTRTEIKHAFEFYYDKIARL